MDCKRVDEMLADYLGGELPAADRTAVDEHLGDCTRCAEEVRSLESTVNALAGLEAGTFERSPHVVAMRGGFWRQGLAYAAVLIIGCCFGWVMKPADGIAERGVGPGVKTNVQPPSGTSFNGTSFVNADIKASQFKRNAYRLIRAFSGGR